MPFDFARRKTSEWRKKEIPERKRLETASFRHTKSYLQISALSQESALKMFHTSVRGISAEEARWRRETGGANEISHETERWKRQLFRALVNPFILLLTGLAVVSSLTDDVKGALVMATMVVVSVCLTFFQEFRSSRAAEKLKAMVSTSATVTRRAEYPSLEDEPVWISRRQEVPISDLVWGDIVTLSAGDMVPADSRLLASKDLFVSQSALTGESLPVEKQAVTDGADERDLLDIGNLLFMGTTVVSGTATALVIKTGPETYLGSIAKNASSSRIQTSFDKGIQRFTWLMLRFMAVMVPLVFLINGLTKGNWFEAFLFAVAVAVGLTPEMLPMIVTVNLAKGALSMAKKKVIVKRLNSIQNFGAMDVLCTDKTGTLTRDKVCLERYVDVLGEVNERVLRYAYLNSHYQTGLKNLLDVAILAHAEVAGELDVKKRYRKVDEIPFDFSRKRMSVVVEKIGSRHILICKGALEEMFDVCRWAEAGGEVIPIGEVPKDRCYAIARRLNEEGLRVIAVAYKEVPASRADYSVADESDLTLLGYVAFLDPPKETAEEAIRGLSARGVKVKVLTGDNDRVTRKVCHDVGLPDDDIVLGHRIEAMEDAELDDLVERSTVFAKLTPAHKERIVRSLHRRGHVVGFLGDGINDAPALKAADVGISVDNAVDVAKESADIILLEKNLLVLEDGVVEGRKVFGNIVKYIKMGASSNFGNVFSVLGASSILPFLPMLPVQLLTQNLLYDLSQTAIPFDSVDHEYLDRPRRWDIGDIRRFMLFIGPISSVFDYAMFAVLWFVLGASDPSKQSVFQSGWFIEGLLSQTLIVHLIRTRRIPFLQSRASLPLLATTLVVMAAGVCLPFSRVGPSLGLTALPPAYFGWLAAVLAGYCVSTQLVKSWFIRRYGYH